MELAAELNLGFDGWVIIRVGRVVNHNTKCEFAAFIDLVFILHVWMDVPKEKRSVVFISQANFDPLIWNVAICKELVVVGED